MGKNDAGNTSNLPCPNCSTPWVHYLICASCGYYEGTAV